MEEHLHSETRKQIIKALGDQLVKKKRPDEKRQIFSAQRLWGQNTPIGAQIRPCFF
jgi:hypothetical protein